MIIFEIKDVPIWVGFGRYVCSPLPKSTGNLETFFDIRRTPAERHM